MMDLLLYLSQNAFNRKIGQERNELMDSKWMQDNQQEFYKAARILKLIDRHDPKYQKYDIAWITGASRIGLLARIINYKFITYKYHLTIKEKPLVLAGARELWANIDGIKPDVLEKLEQAISQIINIDLLDATLTVGDDDSRTEEGKQYILNLAKENNVELNSKYPFIEYQSKEVCPEGRLPGRTYPNYADGEKCRLTETTMSCNLLETYLPDSIIVDSPLKSGQRPDTASTAREAFLTLMQKIQKSEYGDQKEFIILFITNNPYIERQTILAQREINKLLQITKLNTKGYSIKLDGVGFKSKQDIPTVHSEFAALLTEYYKDAINSTSEPPTSKRSIETLLYQYRDNTKYDIPPEELLDSTWDFDALLGLCQDIWDWILS